MAPGAHDTDLDAANPDPVTAEWRDEHLPSFFARWHRQNAALLQETTAAMIAAAAIAPGFTVLDVACGSPLPALDVSRCVGTSGSVTVTGPSPIMIASFLGSARQQGLT